MTPRAQVTELAKRLREAAHLQDPLARAAVEMVKLSHEELKESLVNADGEDMYRMQGAARHMAKLFRELTVEPPTINKSGAQ
jgi:hypothetical protein